MKPATRLALLLAAALALPHVFPASAPAQAPAQRPAESPEAAKRREEEETARRANEARVKEIRQKLKTMKDLIKEVNSDLQLRTAGLGTFERKRTIENQLRDYITTLSLAEEALAQAERLAQEVEGLRKSMGAGPRDPQRLQLMNFLDARRQEYVLFATR